MMPVDWDSFKDGWASGSMKCDKCKTVFPNIRFLYSCSDKVEGEWPKCCGDLTKFCDDWMPEAYMRTVSLRVPEPGEVWFKESHWGACFITPNGLNSFSQGNEQYPSLLPCMGELGNSSYGDKTPILFERDGWVVYDSYAEFIEHRRKVMIENLQETIRTVNEVCDREVAKGSPLNEILRGTSSV